MEDDFDIDAEIRRRCPMVGQLELLWRSRKYSETFFKSTQGGKTGAKRRRSQCIQLRIGRSLPKFKKFARNIKRCFELSNMYFARPLAPQRARYQGSLLRSLRIQTTTPRDSFAQRSCVLGRSEAMQRHLGVAESKL